MRSSAFVKLIVCGFSACTLWACADGRMIGNSEMARLQRGSRIIDGLRMSRRAHPGLEGRPSARAAPCSSLLSAIHAAQISVAPVIVALGRSRLVSRESPTHEE